MTQVHSYTLDTLATLGGANSYYLQIGRQLDAISADMKGFNDNE